MKDYWTPLLEQAAIPLHADDRAPAGDPAPPPEASPPTPKPRQRGASQRALRLPRRRDLLAAVQANPGIGFRELSRLAGLAVGTTRHHLNVLRREGFIVERRHGATLRLFPAAADHDPGWVEVVLRRDPALAALLDWLRAHPRASQGRAVQGMAERGWPRSTTQHRLGRLVAAGVVAQASRGRIKRYTPVAEQGPPGAGPPDPSRTCEGQAVDQPRQRPPALSTDREAHAFPFPLHALPPRHQTVGGAGPRLAGRGAVRVASR